MHQEVSDPSECSLTAGWWSEPGSYRWDANGDANKDANGVSAHVDL